MTTSAFTADDFRSQVEALFLVFTEVDSAIDMRLTHVVEEESGSFSLTLRGGQGEALPDGVYRVENAALGTVELTLTCIEPSEYGAVYRAEIG